MFLQVYCKKDGVVAPLARLAWDNEPYYAYYHEVGCGRGDGNDDLILRRQGGEGPSPLKL